MPPERRSPVGPAAAGRRRTLLVAFVTVGCSILGLSVAGCGSSRKSAAPAPAQTLPPLSTTGTNGTIGTTGAALPTITVLDHELVASHPHDPDAFTQGLVVDEQDRLFESVGRYGRSSLREVELESGSIIRSADNSEEHFAEGLALVGNDLVQITWKEHTALVWDRETFTQTGTRAYDTEGWGLCYDGRRLVMSDGSATLVFRDPETFVEQGRVEVTRDGRALRRLNELECVDGKVYANVWQTDVIVVIDPASGAVVEEVDLTGILPADQRAGIDVLNGIAYRPSTGTFLVTGKLWPTLFEVRLVPG